MKESDCPYAYVMNNRPIKKCKHFFNSLLLNVLHDFDIVLGHVYAPMVYPSLYIPG